MLCGVFGKMRLLNVGPNQTEGGLCQADPMTEVRRLFLPANLRSLSVAQPPPPSFARPPSLSLSQSVQHGRKFSMPLPRSLPSSQFGHVL